MPLFVTDNDWLLWINILLNAAEGIVTLMIIIVLLRWSKRMVQFMELMDQMAEEKETLLRQNEEWTTENNLG